MHHRLATCPRRLAAVLTLLCLMAAFTVPAPAVGYTGYRHTVLAKAAPDECFAGVGIDYPPGPPCRRGVPKVNQSYVWGLAKDGDHRLWFGTGANLNCLTSGRNLEPSEPAHNDDWVCEYGQSQLARQHRAVPESAGDHRPPEVYVYDLRSRRLIEKTGEITRSSREDARRLATTVGIRAAVVHQGVVLLGGPSGLTVNLFAFDARTGEYLGSQTLRHYGNIRHFVVADRALYAGVGKGVNGSLAGRVLRWTGSRNDPFRFVEVGDLPGQVADLAVHKGRIFVTTWPSAAATRIGDDAHAALYMSPPLARGRPGLHRSDATAWAEVWSVAEYEPDPVIARTAGLGGLASFGGYLYWGTMHVPMKATYEHLRIFPPANEDVAQVTVEQSQRAISIFRGTDFGRAGQQVQLLYGASDLPAYDPNARRGDGAWASAPTGYAPLYGGPGMGNSFNNYTWRMVVAGGTLYVGTMDWGYLSRHLAGSGPDGLNQAAVNALAQRPRLLPEPPPGSEGADLFAFDSPGEAARVVDSSGMGNYLNYGVRNIVADGDTLYLGMANPMNLRTDASDNVPEGGWELIRLAR